MHGNGMNTHDRIHQAANFLRVGEVVAAPTETVYGLFADAKNDGAIQKIYRIKGRPSHNPLIIHVSNLQMAQEYAVFTKYSTNIAKYFWEIAKLPLTIVLKSKTTQISRYATAVLDTIAIRVPHHELSLRLINEFGAPLAAPSANSTNFISPTSAEMVKHDLGHKLQLILDGGPCSVGIESTIIDLTTDNITILRHGGVSQEQIEEFCNHKLLINQSSEINLIKSPGMMKRHYSPKLPLRINVKDELIDGEAFIAFGPSNLRYHFNLSPIGDLNQAAKNLFYALSSMDNPIKWKGIAVMPIPDTGIGRGINDRLKRASAR
jgi:L-threonylcarbamoyladenylate synthase